MKKWGEMAKHALSLLVIMALLLLAFGSSSSSSDCYDLGFRYGRCAALAMKGRPCDPADDIVIPEECRGKEETLRGIKDGTKSVW